MKKISVFILLALACNVVFAQNNEDKNSAFQLSFITPLSTNGLRSCEYTNKVSLNLLVGVSKNEKYFTFGGLTNVILNDASGFQLAGISNHIGNEGRGFQFAGLANTNKSHFNGFQFAGLVNTAGSVNGVQFGGLANIAKDASGFQLGGLANIAKDINGFQFAGLINTAGDMNGFQFAGLINIAKDVKGVQFAGLVNIAENSDCPIGLINIIKNGEKSIAVTYDGIGNTVVSFRSGGKYTYGILGVGYNHKVKENGLVTEAGFGAHIPIVKWFRINNELKAASIGCDNPVFNAGYSLIPEFRICQHLGVFAGVGINYMHTDNVINNDVFPNHSLWKKYSTTKLQQLYIGYQVGVQYIF